MRILMMKINNKPSHYFTQAIESFPQLQHSKPMGYQPRNTLYARRCRRAIHGWLLSQFLICIGTRLASKLAFLQ